MAKFIHTVPAGVTDSEFGVAGSIIGVATLNKSVGDATAADFDNAGMVAAGIAFVQVPDAAAPKTGAVLGTALPAGTGNTAFATVTAFETGMNFPPVEGLTYNGTVWTQVGGRSGGTVATLTIPTAGTGCTTGSGKATVVTTDTDQRKFQPVGLTVNVTAVDGSGGITSVAVTNGGHAYKVGDQVAVTDGANNAILEVATIVYPQIGTFNTARPTANPNRLSPSYFPTHPPGLTGAGVYLHQPTTGARVYYDDTLSGNFRFSSGTVDIFDGSDFTLQVKTVGGDVLLGTLTMPAASNTNADVNFNAAS